MGNTYNCVWSGLHFQSFKLGRILGYNGFMYQVSTVSYINKQSHWRHKNYEDTHPGQNHSDILPFLVLPFHAGTCVFVHARLLHRHKWQL